MKYISIDTETTGLDPECCNVIEFAAIIEDTDNPLPLDQLPKFHVFLEHKEYTGSAYAISMHQRIWDGLKDLKNSPVKVIGAATLAREFSNFLVENGIGKLTEFGGHTPTTITVAGKNFGTFDLQFLKKSYKWEEYIKVRHRIIDPALLYLNLSTDTELPGLDECKKRAGLDGVVSHNAVEDAFDVILLLRNKFNENNGETNN